MVSSDSRLLNGPEPSGGLRGGGKGLGTSVANQAALTRLDFQHIKQVGLSIKVTPSVSAEGRERRGGRQKGAASGPGAHPGKGAESRESPGGGGSSCSRGGRGRAGWGQRAEPPTSGTHRGQQRLLSARLKRIHTSSTWGQPARASSLQERREHFLTGRLPPTHCAHRAAGSPQPRRRRSLTTCCSTELRIRPVVRGRTDTASIGTTAVSFWGRDGRGVRTQPHTAPQQHPPQPPLGGSHSVPFLSATIFCSPKK